ncbi:universal stress protein [Saccharopolyspora rhizosphaerae]|uniref:Universal stress protein n=1 Tax=Saccharopolyspora rhizosphaerae TaxID=2492662 RepID=A0A426JZV1_9PSEU|nr:universal stress protein [Saccharopolyspora rhizosphaerae]RRO18648.1 universal stress protein [Saccharopolyspora rhizosphaerae]
MSTPDKPVVVGIDGSDDATRAAGWAVTEADRRQAPLLLVIVNDDPARTSYAEGAVHRTADKCRAMAPQLSVDVELASGRPVEELLRYSRQAQLVVLGGRGHGGFTDALLGGVSSAVATHASCPVVVVRRGVPTTAGPVLVGVDGSDSSTAALRFAFEEAQLAGAQLLVVEVWHEGDLLAGPLRREESDRVQEDVERSLADQVSAVQEQFPDIRTRLLAQRGHPVAALTDAGRDAQLLVVGHRGRGEFGGLFLGSVAAGVLHHAPCPVAVVRHAAARSS